MQTALKVGKSVLAKDWSKSVDDFSEIIYEHLSVAQYNKTSPLGARHPCQWLGRFTSISNQAGTDPEFKEAGFRLQATGFREKSQNPPSEGEINRSWK